jgi:hypothetical protein
MYVYVTKKRGYTQGRRDMNESNPNNCPAWALARWLGRQPKRARDSRLVLAFLVACPRAAAATASSLPSTTETCSGCGVGLHLMPNSTILTLSCRSSLVLARPITAPICQGCADSIQLLVA